MIRTHILIRRFRIPAMLLASAFAVSMARAQQPQPISPTSPIHQPTLSNDDSGFGNASPHDPGQARMLREMTRDRNNLRQKEIVNDTNQLLDLAKQLQNAVNKSNKNELSLSVVNTAAEIEKLAKVVKDKMRDGQ